MTEHYDRPARSLLAVLAFVAAWGAFTGAVNGMVMAMFIALGSMSGHHEEPVPPASSRDFLLVGLFFALGGATVGAIGGFGAGLALKAAERTMVTFMRLMHGRVRASAKTPLA